MKRQAEILGSLSPHVVILRVDPPGTLVRAAYVVLLE